MTYKVAEKAKFLLIVFSCVIACLIGFNFLILQQENILRKYFILNPQEKMRELNASLSESLSKSFVRENRYASMNQVTDYIRRYGSTPAYELFFVFQDKDGSTKQISKLGVSIVSNEMLTGENVYPVTVDNGNMDGYLMVIIRAADTIELKEGLARYKIITYSLKLIFLLLAAALLIIIFYHDYSAKMRLARDMAEIKASNDGLTGMHTHEYFMKILNIEVEKMHLYNTPMALLMLDIDHFKDFNDKFGHMAGDKVLEEVSKLIKISTRATDILARYGGEEFAVIIPYVAKPGDMPGDKRAETFLEEIKGVAERIRKNVEDHELEFASNILKVTISVGIAFYYKKIHGMTSAAILEKSDSALYEAKRLGRNRVHIHYVPSDF